MESFTPDTAREPSVAEDPALGLDRRTKFQILGAVLLGLFLATLDQTVVGTPLPRIVTALNGNELYTWVVTIYLLTSTITVPFYGKLSDLYGRKPLLMFGISLFLIGSALSGLSQEMWQLVLFRGIQGLGAGSLFPIALAVIGDLFTPAERGKYQGLFGAVFGVSFLLGPWLGGFLTDNLSWHWVFYVNLPIGLVSLYLIWRLMPNIRHPEVSRSLDYAGAAVFAVAMGLILVGLTNKQTNDWLHPSVAGLIGGGLVLSVLFIAIEARAREPIVPLDLWRNRTYVSSILATFFVSFAFFGAIIFMPRWFQAVRSETATMSGYLLFPLLFGLIGSSIVSGQIISRTGRYRTLILAAIGLIAAGLVLMTQLRADTDYLPLFGWLFVAGVGIGPTLSGFTIVVQNAVPFSKLGVATSNLTFFRQIGGTVGLAIAGSVFGSSLTERLPAQAGPVFGQIIAGLPADLQEPARQALQSGAGQRLDPNALTGVGQSFGEAVIGQVPAQFQSFVEPFRAALDAAFGQAMTLAIADTFVVGIGAILLAFAVGLGMRELPLRTTRGAPVAAATGSERPAEPETRPLRQAPAAD